MQLSEYELAVAADIVDPLPLPISWKDIGGLRETIDEVKVKITKHLLNYSLTDSPTLGALEKSQLVWLLLARIFNHVMLNLKYLFLSSLFHYALKA